MREMEAFLQRKKAFYEHPEQYLVKPFQIMGNLYFIGNQDVASYLIDTGDGLVILDTGYPTTQGMLVYSITALGFRVEDIRVILHTHGHFDHIGGTALLKELSHGVTYLGWRDAKMFEERPELSLKEYSGCPCFTLFTPDKVMGDGDVIRLGDTEITVRETPGHSDGTVSFFFRVEEGGNVYRCGLMGGSGLNTLTDAFIKTYGRSRARAEFLTSLEKLCEEKVDINLGNHTNQNFTMKKREQMEKASMEGRNPFVDSQEWKRFLDGTRRRYEEMVASP